MHVPLPARRRARRLLPIVLAAAVLSGCGAGPAVPPVPPVQQVQPVRATSSARDLLILADWDRRRAAAWAAADPGALRRLYLPGAGTADVALLAAYRSRGLRVLGLRMQLISARTLVRRPRLLRLEVVDRLVGGTAVRHGRAIRMPGDLASRRVLTLRRPRAVWLMAGVEE